MGVARDGQGLEVGAADAGAIEALDFLREEWLVFGKRFQPFMAAAEHEEHCPLLPTLAANLVLSMNSSEGCLLGAQAGALFLCARATGNAGAH